MPKTNHEKTCSSVAIGSRDDVKQLRLYSNTKNAVKNISKVTQAHPEPGDKKLIRSESP